nr:zinc finger, CCHC-type [Tanacetum cinerariifolium]
MFKRVDFRRWKKKMHFLLSSISVVYVLTTPILDDSDDATVEQLRKRAKWDNDDYVCRGLILNEQYNELLGILGRFTQHKMNMDEAIQVSCIIDKLPPSWKDFKHTLKHLKDELTLVELSSHLCIKESLRLQDSDKPKGNNVVGPLVVNMVEHNKSFRYNAIMITQGLILTRRQNQLVGNVAKLVSFKMIEKVDSGAIVHVCKDKCWFKTYESLNDGSILHMGNKSTALVHGRGCVDLRLGHVHFKRMQDMSKDGLIPTFDMDTEKCKTFMLTKITRKPFQNVKYKTKVLELIHSDLCDLYATPSLRNKKYYVKFIDDAYRVPNKRNRITSYELWTKRKPNLNYLRVWGCGAVVRLHDPKLKTMGERGIECIFVGYAEHSKAFSPRPSLRISNGIEDIGGSVVPEEDEPKTFNEAMKSYDVAFLKEAINDEMDSIMGNNTWVLADLPQCCKPLGCKWIFKRKPKVDGTIEKFKERLVIQGFKQNSGINYFDTYAPVARINTIRMLIAMVDLTNEFLPSKFSMKDIGEADVIFGIRIKHESNKIAIFKSHYIEKALKKFNYFDCTPVMYAMTCTRPDISFVVGKLSRYTTNPVLEGYSDASWISNTEDNSSTSGWVFLLGEGVISWASKKQTCITGLTLEYKFVALAAAGKEAEWLEN